MNGNFVCICLERRCTFEKGRDPALPLQERFPVDYYFGYVSARAGEEAGEYGNAKVNVEPFPG